MATGRGRRKGCNRRNSRRAGNASERFIFNQRRKSRAETRRNARLAVTVPGVLSKPPGIRARGLAPERDVRAGQFSSDNIDLPLRAASPSGSGSKNSCGFHPPRRNNVDTGRVANPGDVPTRRLDYSADLLEASSALSPGTTIRGNRDLYSARDARQPPFSTAG